MYRLLFCVLCAATLAAGARAQEFAAAAIPPDLRGDAAIVVRLDETSFEVAGPGRALERRHFVATIFSRDGQDAGVQNLWYDRFRRVKKLEGRLLDAGGKPIRKLGKDDVADLSAPSGNLYDDNRVRAAVLRHDVYPYTVEYEYEIEYRGLLHWPAWNPQDTWMDRQDRSAPVEKAVFRLSAPRAVGARYRPQHLAAEPARTTRGDEETLTWTLEGLPSFKVEKFGPTWREQIPTLVTAPTVFEMDDYRGEMATWSDMGLFYATLARGRQVLPDEARADVQRLVAGLESDEARARVLYHYLQRRTRYISVQLGIGGWQPFDAAYVHARGYGDCKALTNYMQALLAEAGITSYPALVRGGVRQAPILDDFPSSQFNHVILFVPLEKDTLWLETTSQTQPFGHLGAFTGDRHALVVKPRESVLVRTPAPTSRENGQFSAARIRLTGTGSAEASLQMRFTGEGQEIVVGALYGRTARERDAWLREQLQVPAFTVQSADYGAIDARADTAALDLRLGLPRYAALTGARLFVPLNPTNRWQRVPDALTEARTQPVVFAAVPFYDEDVVDFVLPTGFAVEALPAPVALETPFARYHARVEPGENGVLRYTRQMEVTRVAQPAADYEAVRAFLAEVSRADRAQMVLKKE